MHEDLSAPDVIKLIRDRLPATSKMMMDGERGIRFVLYDAFVVRGNWDDYGRGNWGFAIELGERMAISTVLGVSTSLCGTSAAVLEAMDAIDRYARLRLGAEYIAAYEAAHPPTP